MSTKFPSTNEMSEIMPHVPSQIVPVCEAMPKRLRSGMCSGTPTRTPIGSASSIRLRSGISNGSSPVRAIIVAISFFRRDR